jgi:hypothetical protein
MKTHWERLFRAKCWSPKEQSPNMLSVIPTWSN